jgi:hypothetical protein
VKRSLFHLACSILIAICCCAALRAQAGAEKPITDRQVRGGIATMYALDPLSRALCFRDGREGMSFLNHRWENRCSDLSFSLAADGSFTTGIEADRVAVIIDLGNADELQERYGYEDAASGGEGFASLQLQGDKILILKDDHPKETFQPLREGPKLFGELGPSANAPVRLGHIYLVRIADKKDKSFQQIVKFMVIAYKLNESVTLRWARL